MTILGQVLEVSITPVGDELDIAAVTNQTVLILGDVSDFSELGGQLIIGVNVYNYVSSDDAAGTVTLLGPGLLGNVAADEPVYVYPLAEEKWAMVESEQDEEAILARVPHGLYDRLTDGIRDDNEQEVVIVDIQDGDWVITDLLSEIPLVDAGFLDPDTTVPPSALTDGLPPATAPTGVTLEPLGIGSLRAKWTAPANADPLTYRVYARVGTGALITDELVATTSATSASFGRLTGVDLAYVLHSVVVLPLDSDGVGPASVEATGTPRQATGPDISAAFAYLGRVEAGQIDAGVLGADVAVAGSFTVAEYDEFGVIVPGTKRAEISPGGLVLYKQDPVTPTAPEIVTLSAVAGNLSVKGDIEADHLTVYDGSIQGGTNEIAEAAVLNLSTGVTSPTNPPSLQATHTSVQFGGTGWATRHGAAFDGTYWYTAKSDSFNLYVDKWTAAGVFVSSGLIHTGIGFSPLVESGGVVYNGTDLYVLYKDSGSWYVQRVNLSLVVVGSSSTWIHADGTRTPTIGWDASTSEILIAQSKASDDKVQVRRYTYNAGGNLTVGGATVTCTTTYSRDLASIVSISTAQATQAGFAAARYVYIGFSVGVDFQVMDTSGVIQTLDRWMTNAIGAVGGICGLHYDGTNFKSLDHAGLLRTYEAGVGNRWTTETDKTWYVAYTWYRTTGGVKETLRGVYSTFTMIKRAKLVVTTAGLPTGGVAPPEAARVYLKKGATTPGVVTTVQNMTLQASTAGTPPMLTVTNAVFTPSNNPTAETFGTAGTPAKLKSNVGGFELNGDGTGLWPLAGIRPDVQCLIRRTSDSNISTSTYEVILFNVEDSDPSNMNNAGVITVPVNGIYRITARVSWASNGTGRRILVLNKNDATVPPPTASWIGRHEATLNTSAGTTDVTFTWEDRLVAADVLRLWAWQNSGGVLALTALYGMPSLSLRWVAP